MVAQLEGVDGSLHAQLEPARVEAEVVRELLFLGLGF